MKLLSNSSQKASIRDDLRRSQKGGGQQPDIGTKEVTSAKNTAAREPGFLSFINDNSNKSSDQRRSRRFDQVLDDDDFGRVEDELFMGDGVDEEILADYCAPIQCNEDDDGPDFSRMTKKSLTEQPSRDANKKGQDIRKRFEIEKPKGSASAIAGNLISPGSSTNSHNTVSTDMSLNNPLAESLTAEMLLRQ